MYAIVDIETTGGKFNEEGITEIALYKFDGHRVVDQFISLVNPEKDIQPFVVQLTGISNKMLENAPKFYEIAKRVLEITENCIVVAHNTSFDYRILRTEFDRLGYEYIRKTLCTIELSKKLIPDQQSYSLGKLCRAIGIPVSDRHRASGDALATLKLLELLLDKDVEKEILKNSIQSEFPQKKKLTPKLLNILDTIPSTSGVFYVHQNNGTILYIGKGDHLNKTVNQLFARTSKKAKTLQKTLKSISYEETGNELIKNLKFYEELHKNKPRFNTKHNIHVGTSVFQSENMLLIDKGRTTFENSVILIEAGEIKGFGFVNLAHQIEDLEIVKKILLPIRDDLTTRHYVKEYMQKGKLKKIIRF